VLGEKGGAGGIFRQLQRFIFRPHGLGKRRLNRAY
jgi:hypothetical protein